jgi:hypothetical protein
MSLIGSLITLSESDRVLNALSDMMAKALNDPGYELPRYVDLPTALLVIEVAKRADDREDWFPCGKWATVQALQGRVERELEDCFRA